MSQINHIVIAADFSLDALRAARRGALLARERPSSLKRLHVVPE